MKIKNLLIGASLLALSVLAVGCGKKEDSKTLDVSEFIKVECEGYDGYANATITVDTDAITKKVAEVAKDSSNIEAYLLENYLETIEISSITCTTNDEEETLEDTYYYTFSDVANGSKLKIKVSFEKDLAVAGYEISSSTMTYTVKGLEEAAEVDPFEDLVVTFTGLDGDGDLVMDSTGVDTLITDNGYFYADSSYWLSNGDTVTITYYENWSSELADNGIIISTTSKEYTVDTLGEYSTSYTEADFDTVRDELLTYFKENEEVSRYDLNGAGADLSIWPEYSIELSDYEYYKSYYAYDDDLDPNAVFAVYKVNYTATVTEGSNYANISEGEVSTGSAYLILYSYNAYKTPDGETYTKVDYWSGSCFKGYDMVEVDDGDASLIEFFDDLYSYDEYVELN